MSDKLNWMNRHFVLLRHKTLNDVCNVEGYKIRPDIQSFFDKKTDAEEIVWNFAGAGRWKCACELMAYMAHRRAAVWWAYQCLLSLNDELDKVPAEERDIDSIAASFEPTVPDFAKVEIPKGDEEEIKKAQDQLAVLNREIAELREQVDPKMMKLVEDSMNYAFNLFKEQHGMTPMELLKMALDKRKGPPQQVDPESPIFKAADQLEAQLKTVRKETLDTIHAVIPPKVSAHEKKMHDEALQVVYRWIVSPDEINAKKALDIGNECSDTPAGMLSLCAFWAGGNLMPDPKKDQIVPTPSGLAANGICQVLLMCALHKGGTRKLKERYEHYFNLGVEVLTGKNNWEKSVVDNEVLHDMEVPTKTIEKDVISDKITTAENKPSSVVYKRWKPE